MKLGKYFLGLTLVAAGLTSCNTDNVGPIYDGPAQANISFAIRGIDTETEESSMTIPVTITRTYSTEAYTANITMTDVNGNNVKLRDSQVTFAPGEEVVSTAVDITDIQEGSVYSCVLHLSPADVATANEFENQIHDMSISVLRRKWNSLGMGHYVSPEWWGEEFDVEIKQADGTNLYKMIGLFADGYDIKFEITEDNEVYVDKQESWVHPSYGPVSLWGYATGDGSGYAGPYDPETKMAKLTLQHTVAAGSFGAYVDFLYMP